jgi:hypothetical protein
MKILARRFLFLIGVLIVVTAVSCSSSRHGVTRYNSTKQMHKHSTLHKIPRSKAGKEQRYKRKGPRDKVMNKSK